jgi:hypothetical protein
MAIHPQCQSYRLSRPITTESPLNDIVKWICLGDCVVLHREDIDTLVLHNCYSKFTSLNDKRVIWITVSTELGKDSPTFHTFVNSLIRRGCQHCTCNLKDRVITRKKIPYFYEFNI